MAAGQRQRYAYDGTVQYEAEDEDAAGPYAKHRLEAIGDDEPIGLLGWLPPMAVGYLICCVVLLEGIFVVLDCTSPAGSTAGSLAGLDRQNSFHRLQWALLEALGAGDLAAAALGAGGLWLAGNALPLYPGRLREWHAWLSTFCVGALVAWRILVTLAVVPWVGFMLTFEPPEYSRWTRLAGALLYMAVSMYLLSLLVPALGAAAQGGRLVQEQLLAAAQGEEEEQQEQRALLQHSGGGAAADGENVGLPEEGPVLFACLPLEPAVAGYALCACAGSLWFFTNLVSAGRTGGGWAFLTAPPQQLNLTFWIEAVVYVVTIVFSALAASAIMAYRNLDPQDAAARPAQKRCAVLLLAFFAACVLRFAFFVPITGMALAARDFCGLYVHGLASVSLDRRLYPAGAPVRCTAAEWGALAAMVATLLADGHCIWGALQLWWRYRSASAGGYGGAAAHTSLYGKAHGSIDYGAASAIQ